MNKSPLIPLTEIEGTIGILLSFEPPFGVNYEVITRSFGADFDVKVRLWVDRNDIHVYQVTGPADKTTMTSLIRESERILSKAWNDADAAGRISLGGNVAGLDTSRMGKDG